MSVTEPSRASLQTSGDLAADRRYAWAMAALRDGAAGEAADLFAQAAELAPAWVPACLGLGDARLAAGDDVGAAEAFRRCLALDPADRLGAGPRLARLGHLDAGRAISDAYVAQLFDDYAPRFEAHLTQDLGYRGPALVMRALDALAPHAVWSDALDLGCGTGLMGEALRPRVSHLTGCDLAQAMVALARGRGVYDVVETASLAEALARAPEGSLDLVTAADVLVYAGDLAPVFAGVARALRPGGLFAFTAQTFAPGEESGSGLAIGDDLRCRHSAGLVRLLADRHGLPVVHLTDAWARRDRGVPLPGLVGICRKG